MNCFAFSRPKIWKINGQVQSLVFALHVCLLGPPTLIFSWQCHSSSKLLHKQNFRAGFSFLLYFGLSPSLFLPLRLSASGQAPSSHDLSPFLTLSKPIGSGWHHCNTQMWQLGGGRGVVCRVLATRRIQEQATTALLPLWLFHIPLQLQTPSWSHHSNKALINAKKLVYDSCRLYSCYYYTAQHRISFQKTNQHWFADSPRGPYDAQLLPLCLHLQARRELISSPSLCKRFLFTRPPARPPARPPLPVSSSPSVQKLDKCIEQQTPEVYL